MCLQFKKVGCGKKIVKKKDRNLWRVGVGEALKHSELMTQHLQRGRHKQKCRDGKRNCCRPTKPNNNKADQPPKDSVLHTCSNLASFEQHHQSDRRENSETRMYYVARGKRM